MSLKNLSANRIPNILKNKLLNKRIYNLYKTFEKDFKINESFIVAVSGGPDSLALAFLTKIYSFKKNLESRYYIVDHKLRRESTYEAKKVNKILNEFNIKSKILTWKGKKPKKNLQSLARQKRYKLLFSECKKLKIKNLILGHHIDDSYENFFIRIVRGSGLRGLVSFGKNTKINEINLIRPLLEFQKKDLIFISSFVFNFFIKDPSNENDKFLRIKVRNLISQLKDVGFDQTKLSLTLKNLKSSNDSIIFYVKNNKKLNSYFNKKKKELILNQDFFNQPYDVVFRSLSESIKLIGEKYNLVRGKKLEKILKKIQENSLSKETLGGCVIKKVNQTVILRKES
tara:strand:+ start:234 stop:1259 length:1026 start_codon:yes stop_codon:yes gene_type:complete